MSENNFKDKGINEHISEYGYAVVPFINREQIEELRNFYLKQPQLNMEGTHVTMFNPSKEYRGIVDRKIKEICENSLLGMMNNYRALYCNYMVKEPGEAGNFPVHQDWTYVDESKQASFAFWIPLQDVDNSNGALHVVRGSHRFVTALRGPYIYEPFKTISETIREKHSELIPMKAGEALIWDHRLIHFSLPNSSLIPRLAVTLIAVPEKAQVIHCFGLNESQGTIIEKYEVDTDFYLQYTIGKTPTEARFLERCIQKGVDISENELITWMNKPVRP